MPLRLSLHKSAEFYARGVHHLRPSLTGLYDIFSKIRKQLLETTATKPLLETNTERVSRVSTTRASKQAFYRKTIDGHAWKIGKIRV